MSLIKNTDICLVCSTPTSGFHFQINSCRACSAFWRRSQQGERKYRCRRNSKNCEVHYSIKNVCRYCRFEKCKKVGMKWKKDRQYSDSSDVEESTSFMKSPSSVNSTKSNINIKQEIGVSSVTSDDTTNLTTAVTISKQISYYYTPLQYLSYGIGCYLTNINKELSIEKVEITRKFTFRKYAFFTETCCTEFANALSVSPQYASLPETDKAIIFNNVWSIIHSIERVYTSIKLYGAHNPDIVILFNNCQASTDKFAYLDDEELSSKDKEDFYNLFLPANKFLVSSMYLPMKELNFDDLEFSFLIGYALWSVQGIEHISNETKDLGRKLIRALNDEIHSYYTFVKKLDNYAHRLSEIINLVAATVKYRDMKKEIVLTSKIFNVFDVCKVAADLLKREPKGINGIFDVNL
uniref:Nuclear receptor n=1 Tax=Parastrongyloides trichosuri TaxID=131310 RepID=A0A0N4ZW40_PARTI